MKIFYKTRRLLSNHTNSLVIETQLLKVISAPNVPSIDNIRLFHYLFELLKVRRLVWSPFSDKNKCICIFCRIILIVNDRDIAFAVVQVSCIICSDRIMSCNDSSISKHCVNQRQRWGLTYIVCFGFECYSPHSNLLSPQITAELLTELAHQHTFLPLIHFISCNSQLNFNIIISTSMHQCGYILWKTRSSVSRARIQKSCSNSCITSNTMPDTVNVCTNFFT
mmetsp:Transcript_2248/g.4099  ORF Transcript_2248/g.4099 Transcript_2248/m.4099 type:complete len:223 (-) Transcript_2248:741-1409(-)